MDNLRGNFDTGLEGAQDESGYDPAEDDRVDHTPPAAIGQDERRMQVRAYNHWAGLLQDRAFPCIEDLEPETLDDFGPYSVLLDFSSGIENPGISYLGAQLADECDIDTEELARLDDVPSRSLLSRITDHYMQILANQAPIGFEAEFVNQRGKTILYRGILLPYSSDDDTIDFIYGVINWKELADAGTSDELLLEIDQALEDSPLSRKGEAGELADWADGPANLIANDPGDSEDETDIAETDDALELAVEAAEHAGEKAEDDDGETGEETADVVPFAGLRADESDEDDGLPSPSFGASLSRIADARDDEDLDDDEEDDPHAGMGRFASLVRPASSPDAPRAKETAIPSPYESDADKAAAFDDQPAMPEEYVPDYMPAAAEDAPGSAPETATVIDLPEVPQIDPEDMELGDWLAAARECAAEARSSEDRTRHTLYEAIGRAYDFSIAAIEDPDDFADLLADSGLTMQDRAPMTPVVKLVFGADYDKTRLTEYAAALSHAHRLELPRGGLSGFLREADGGLKGVVQAERRLRREENGETALTAEEAREQLIEQLRAMPPQGFDALDGEGEEFALLMVRRLEDGRVVLLGEVPEDAALVERAAKKLVG